VHLKKLSVVVIVFLLSFLVLDVNCHLHVSAMIVCWRRCRDYRSHHYM